MLAIWNYEPIRQKDKFEDQSCPKLLAKLPHDGAILCFDVYRVSEFQRFWTVPAGRPTVVWLCVLTIRPSWSTSIVSFAYVFLFFDFAKLLIMFLTESQFRTDSQSIDFKIYRSEGSWQGILLVHCMRYLLLSDRWKILYNFLPLQSGCNSLLAIWLHFITCRWPREHCRNDRVEGFQHREVQKNAHSPRTQSGGSSSDVRCCVSEPFQVLQVEWSPDGRYLASCSLDGSIIVWRAAKLSEQVVVLNATKDGHSQGVKGISWDPIGRYLASQSQDKVRFSAELLGFSRES